ncbi:unnamed protein product [Miscanthus lutarioriparius]|uniref:Uncharacterized protein n=1 Tax=Miscanthus lutarioriparius TaxID=422564 RepID=A0A811QKQ3_9POAL|nr:unnamed protein product [Miscanthus lutarioriparius]
MPTWKLGRDVFFGKLSVQLMGATLVDRGQQRILFGREAGSGVVDGSARMLKITSFFLKYGKDGDLRTTHHRA